MLALAVFEIFPDGRDTAQVRNDFGNHLDYVVNLFHVVVLTDGESQGAVCYLVRQADAKQNMAGIKRTGGACGAGGCANALRIKEEQEAFALNALEAHIDSAGNVMLK